MSSEVVKYKLTAKWATYPNPPIMEAVLDIRVQVVEGGVSRLSPVQSEFMNDFPKVKPVAFQSLEARFTESQQPVVTAGSTPAGVQMHSENQPERLVLTLEGMTVGRLKP